MAVYYARSSGNVNGAIWATTPTGTPSSVTFNSSDILVANNFSPTINVSISVAQIRNDAYLGATAGGNYQMTNGITITADCISGDAYILVFYGPTGNIVGSLYGPNTATNSRGGLWVHPTAGGTLNITGNLYGPSVSTASNSPAISMSTGITINIIGNITGGLGGANSGGINSAGIINVTGNVSSGPILGAAVSGAGVGINNTGSAVVTITGTVSGDGNSGVVMSTNGSVTINGSCNGSNVNSSYTGVTNSSTGGTITINGTCTGGVAVGAANTSTGTLIVKRAKGGPQLNSAAGVSSGTSSVTSVEEIEFGDLGASPTSGPIRLTNNSTNVAVMYRYLTTKKPLVDTSNSSLIPSASDVRSGIVYNNSASTGTCIIPSASNVMFGVPVDSGTGTATISSALIQSSCDSSLSSFSGGRLTNCATVASVAKQLSDALGT